MITWRFFNLYLLKYSVTKGKAYGTGSSDAEILIWNQCNIIARAFNSQDTTSLHFVCRLGFDMHNISEIEVVFGRKVFILGISSADFLIFYIVALRKPRHAIHHVSEFCIFLTRQNTEKTKNQFDRSKGHSKFRTTPPTRKFCELHYTWLSKLQVEIRISTWNSTT